MAHNFHDINGWLIVGLEMHQGFHIFPPAPMKFLKLVLLHPFTLGDKQKPTVLFNGVPSVTHQHEPKFLWPHLGIIPDPLDALTPLHILFGSHKCWLPRGAVEICGEKATCCVIGGPVSLNADCWDIGRWPTSLVLNPGTVQTTPTFGDFAMGAVTLAIDLVLDLLFEGAAKLAGGLLLKFGGKVLKPLFKKGKDLVGKGLRAATKQMGKAGKALGKGARALKGKAASALKNAKCFFTGHPVDATSGTVVDRKVDLSLPGAIPLLWERHYSSARALERTSLGRGGWTHGLEQWIEADEAGITLRDEQGRDVYFPRIAAGESAFHRPDRLTLRAEQGGGFSVYSHASRLTRRFAPAAPQGRAWLRAIEDAHGNAITLEYTGERLHRVVDTAGREVRVKMSHGGRIARLEVWAESILEQWVDYAYTKMGELASATDALGHAEHYGYDEDHRMVKTTLKNGVSFYYDYDPETGWCRKTWGDGGLHTVELRVDLEQRITWLTGNEEPRILHWNEDGIVVREETPDGIVLRTCEVDEDQYVLAEANGAGEATRYEYDARGNKIREIDPAGNVTQWEFEHDLPVVRVGPDALATRYEHDGRGSLTGITYPSRLRYALSYDERGHLRAIQGEEGVLASFVVDGRHRVVEEIDARGARTVYGYDRLGRPVSRTDGIGRVTSMRYDRLGKPLVMQRPDRTVMQAAYDALGNPSRIVDAVGQVTEMEYAGTGVLTKLKQPDGRAWSLKYTSREKLRCIINPKMESYEFVYDAAGRVTEEKTFDGRVLGYRYSAGGRLSRLDYPDGSFRSFSHDPLGNLVREDATDGPISFYRDSLGRLLGAAVEQDGKRVVTRFERDAFGRLVAETQGESTIRYGYDARGRRVSRAMPDGTTTRYAYDVLDDLVRVEHEGHIIAIERDALGRERARGDAEGHFSIRSEYDAMDRIIEQRVDIRAPGGGAPAAAVQRLWRYDPLGRVEQVEDGRWGVTSYRHDSIGQLLEARRGRYREAFDYDAAGSISKMLDGLEGSSLDQEPGDWEIAPGNLLIRTGRSSYAYDERGRRIRKQEPGGAPEHRRTAYTWDCRDRLREVRLPSGERVVFTYDAFGRRLRKEVFDADGVPLRDVRFLWDGDVLAADVDDRHGPRCFVFAPGTFVPLLQAERGEVFIYLNDHVGVPKELLDARGSVAWSASHSVWGRLTQTFVAPERQGGAGREVASPFRLMGQYADEETNLCYTRFRYFDAEVGRWCSPDPLGTRGGLNAFGFDGEPVNEVDPLGLTSGKEHGEAGKAWEEIVRTLSGGQSEIIEGREIDSVNQTELIQAKDSTSATNSPRNFLNKKTRTQIKETVRLAEEQGKKAVYWFRQEPHADVRSYIEEKRAEVRVGTGGCGGS
ncbi:restriction endonuclease fold toxin [Sorangium sp. So ce385]|uniref:restriction endonuclease fold toxin n=1 Tax=Sorangium sp. So ce385 TaxID=3133308 RepID=UPI003F5B2B37